MNVLRPDAESAAMTVQEAKKVPLKFEIGARTLVAIQRSLARVALNLRDVREGAVPVLPPIARDMHGYSVTSLPQALAPQLEAAMPDMLVLVRQRYHRYYVDLGIGFDAWWEALSSNTRQNLKRKAKKIASECGGDLDVRRYSSAEELDIFHDIARRISLRTYQEKLLGAGLPDTPEFLQEMSFEAAQGRVRAWLLYVAGEPAAYLYCPSQGDTAIYAYVGHDPAFNDLSPGAVLQLEALRDLFEEGALRYFDFTEGEGQHKRQFASHREPCCDLLLLRPSLTNRLTMTALGGFNRTVSVIKRGVQAVGLDKFARKLRRG